MRGKIFLALSFAILFVFTSCSKYEEGPFISFVSPEKRIQGDYNVQAYYEENTLIPLIDQGISQYRVVYNEDGTGKTYITVNENILESDFEWKLDEKKKNISERVKGQNEQWSSWTEKEILKLTKTEFWFIGSNFQEFHLLKQ